MVTGKPELEIKATPTEFHMENAHLGDYRRQKDETVVLRGVLFRSSTYLKHPVF